MRKYLPLFIFPPIVVLLDQVTKAWIEKHIPIQQAIPVISGYFDLVHFRNRGVAFSFLDQLSQAGHQWFFYAVAVAASIALFSLYRRTAAGDRRMQVPLALILGGALGNLIDRIRLGEVIDFLYFHWQYRVADFDLLGRHFRFPLAWPAFNVADSAITCGALYLALKVLFHPAKDDVKK